MKTKLKLIFTHFLYLTGILWFYLKILRLRGPLVRVLVYHHIYDPNQFVREIEYLKEKYNVISPEDFEKRNFSSKMINILLTFDDGYFSWYAEVLPLFTKHNIRGVFFISSGFINAGEKNTESWQRFGKTNLGLNNPQEPVSWEMIKKLETVGQIGGHTKNHVNLTQCSEEKLLEEIGTDKEELQKAVNTEINWFAAPYGTINEYSSREALAVKNAGYTFAFSTKRSLAIDWNKPHQIPRTMVPHPVSVKQLELIVQGANDITEILNFLYKIIKK